MKKIFILFITICTLVDLYGQQKGEHSPILFIYDASGSMWGQIQGQPKISIAQGVLTTVVVELPEEQKAGLLAYGHRHEGDCRDVEFLVNIQNGNKEDVIQSLKGIKPLGKTPLAYSAMQAINELRTSEQKATIILITDGIESCDGNLCEVIKSAKDEGIDFKLHIIGFGLKEEDTEQLECAANAGDGNYYKAADASGLSEVLNEATKSTIDDAKGNFTVYAIKNGEAIDAWVKAYDEVSKRKPIMVRTYRDTASFYLPPSTYRFEVTPLEGSDVDMISVSNIQSFDDKMGHETISFDGGKLSVTTTNNGKGWDCIVKLFDVNGKVAASVRTYESQKEVEVNPGIYKVNIQALSMEGIHTNTEIEEVKISEGNTTPIVHDFQTGNLEIIAKVGSENIDAIITLKEANSGVSIGGGRTYDRGAKFLLNPGLYEVKAAPLGKHKGKKHQLFQVEIKKGMSIVKELQF